LNHKRADEIDREKRDAILAKYIKEVRTKNELPQSLFDNIQTIIRDYCFYPVLRHGEGVHISGIAEPISWSFNNDYLDEDAHVTVCFKQRDEWIDDRFLDEVPVEFLLHLLKKIKNVMPFRDLRPPLVYDDAKCYVQATHFEKAHKELYKNLKWLNFPPHSSKMRGKQLQ